MPHALSRTRSGHHLNGSGVGLDDLPNHRQPEPRAARAAGKKRLEDLARQLVRDSGAVVGHVEPQPLLVSLGSDDDLAAALRRDYPPVEHPFVRTHPDTGKRALLYARRFIRRIKDLTDAESQAILAVVAEHIAEPSLHCRWSWEAGDLAIWDERSTLHRSAADHWPQERVIRRLEIDGTRPVFV